jgi:hypothetical protein
MGETKYIIAGAAVAAVLLALWVKKKGGLGAAAADAGAAAGDAVVQFGGGVVSGVALGIGDAIGVPRTNMTECEKAKAEGRNLDASFACPAGDFLSYQWNKIFG